MSSKRIKKPPLRLYDTQIRQNEPYQVSNMISLDTGTASDWLIKNLGIGM